MPRGVSIRKIARTLGVSRNTVRKYLKEANPPQFKARKYDKQLDRYREEMQAMLDKSILAQEYTKNWFKKAITALSSVHRFLRAFKEDDKAVKLAITRVETTPGRQMQYDWKEWLLPVEGNLIRMKFYPFSLSITIAYVIRALVEAFDFFGGYALELVMDNGKQMVINHQKDGIVHYNDAFLKFCGLYGIQP